MAFRNPFAFRPGPVTFWTTLVYLVLAVPLIYLHETVPRAPRSLEASHGLNMSQAWLDLAAITEHFHPYNSRDNDRVRDYLLLRIQEILDRNRVDWTTDYTGGVWNDASRRSTSSPELKPSRPVVKRAPGPAVVVFNDMTSNVSMTTSTPAFGTQLGPKTCGLGTYFEGTNIIVYIRGTEDADGEWWKSDVRADQKMIGKGGVLVNAHYDSVSTGFGATDDGMGCVSVLQLIDYFTRPGRAPPRHGIVAMLNNGEEDFLWGARAFAYSPLMPFVHTFLNLEGAGAGGRAMLFRTSDKQVTEAYGAAPHPFGSVIASDGFSLGMVRSQTDYIVLNGIYGERGLDLAFYRPRARYHTDHDDARHASRDSLAHMLATAVPTLERLSGRMGDAFVGPRPDGDRNKVPNGGGSDGVWFDLFGSAFAVFALRGLFAWALTLLIATPLLLFLLTYLLVRQDKYYFFSAHVRLDDHGDGQEDGDKDEVVPLGGWKGFFRFPFAVGGATALVVGSAFLVRKINPLILYSSSYAVWAMMLSLYYTTLWTLMKGANAVRPSALHRGYVHIWLFIFGWAILVPVTVLVDRFHYGFAYPIVILYSAVFLSTVISFCELFALPKKHDFAQRVLLAQEAGGQLEPPSAEALIAPSPGEMEHTASIREETEDEDEEAEPTETTPLRRANDGPAQNSRTTFATTYRRSATTSLDGQVDGKEDLEPFDHEQVWSAKLPSWTWFLQLLLLAPITLVLFGQTALWLTAALAGTGADGGSTLTPYLFVAILTVLVLMPLAPFVHRVSWHVPVFLLLIFAGTLIYNLAAFPFSPENRYKVFFQQTVDLDTGATEVRYSGLEKYVRAIIDELPSAAGRAVACRGLDASRPALTQCAYDGAAVPPRLGGAGGQVPDGVPPEYGWADLVTVNVSRPDEGGGGGGVNRATLSIDARETKACFLNFSLPLTGFAVRGGNEWDPRFGRFPDEGLCQVKLWRRDWERAWTVDIEWRDPPAGPGHAGTLEGIDAEGPGRGDDAREELRVRTPAGGDAVPGQNARTIGLDGRITCVWSDANERGTIPALDEGWRMAPTWVAISKATEGLVEGRKSFLV